MLTAGLSIKNICDFPLSLILLLCSSAPFSFSSSSLLSIQEKHWPLTGQNKTTGRAPTSVKHDTKYCTIIIQHALHKATAKLTRNSRAPRSCKFTPLVSTVSSSECCYGCSSSPSGCGFKTPYRASRCCHLKVRRATKSIHQSTNLMEVYCNSS